jgi:hypothetical protein
LREEGYHKLKAAIRTTQVREALDKSLGGLPPELRYDIARQLMEADIE